MSVHTWGRMMIFPLPVACMGVCMAKHIPVQREEKVSDQEKAAIQNLFKHTYIQNSTSDRLWLFVIKTLGFGPCPRFQSVCVILLLDVLTACLGL